MCRGRCSARSPPFRCLAVRSLQTCLISPVRQRRNRMSRTQDPGVPTKHSRRRQRARARRGAFLTSDGSPNLLDELRRNLIDLLPVAIINEAPPRTGEEMLLEHLDCAERLHVVMAVHVHAISNVAQIGLKLGDWRAFHGRRRGLVRRRRPGSWRGRRSWPGDAAPLPRRVRSLPPQACFSATPLPGRTRHTYRD